MEELSTEILQKCILHWNCRGFTQLPEELKMGELLREIYLKWNNLSYLPSWISNFKSLTNLYLQYNKLESLPEDLSRLSQLNVIDVSNNSLVLLPFGLGRLSNLTEFHAANNMISSIPNGPITENEKNSDFQMLQSLQTLDLSNNSFRHIPETILKCKALQEIFLDNNQLTSLPDNIVYLPHLATLSLSGNNLLYLPFQPFLSNPSLILDNNATLNYISIWLGEQISSQKVRSSENSSWNLTGLQGCFCMERIPSRPGKQNIVVHEEMTGNLVSLTLPSSLETICSGPNCQLTVPTLLELALRKTHGLYCKQLGKEENCKEVTSPWEKPISDHESYLCLPVLLQHRLKVGPVALCYFCQTPIFTYGVIWVTVQNCFFEGGFGPHTSYVLSMIVFCTIGCSVSYTKWERQSGLENKLETRKLNWFQNNIN